MRSARGLTWLEHHPTSWHDWGRGAATLAEIVALAERTAFADGRD